MTQELLILVSVLGTIITNVIGYLVFRRKFPVQAKQLLAATHQTEAVADVLDVEAQSSRFKAYDDIFDEVLTRDKKILDLNIQIANLTARITGLECQVGVIDSLRSELKAANTVIERQASIIAEQAEELQAERRLRKSYERRLAEIDPEFKKETMNQ